MIDKDEIVRGHGPEVSPIMIITDYPTGDECKAKRTCAGPSGELIDSFFKSNKYSSSRCYKTTYIKCPLVGYNSKNKKKSRETLEQARAEANWDQVLNEEIRLIGPNVIIAVGELALNYLTGEKNINKFRGSILPLAPNIRSHIGLNKHIRVIPILHPRDIFVQPITRSYTTLDIGRAIKHIGNTGEITEPGVLWIARTTEALIEYWKRARHGAYLVTDIETQYNFPTCASLCTDGHEAVSFPLFSKELSAMENACIIRKYAEILRSGIPKVNQNIKYDWTVLARLGFQINNIVGDTMLAANVIYPELPKGLDFLASVYTEYAYYKDEGKDYDPKLHDFDRMLIYNAKDSVVCWKVWQAQQQELEELNLKKFYFNFVQPLFFHYKKVEERGIRIDELRRAQLIDKYESLLEKNAIEIKHVYGKELNVRSPKQVGVFIYDFLNCPIHTHFTPNGNEIYSTDEDTIVNMYLNEINDEIVQRVLKQIILCRKIESTLNILETPYHNDARMRTSYNIAGTTTGRTSTAQSTGWYFALDNGKVKQICFGTAFQKIPKHGFEFEGERFGTDIREIFIPSDGYEFFAFDGANAEGRVVCILSDDNTTLDYIEAGNNIHKLTASWIYQKPVDRIQKGSREYDIGKMARHAGNLGQSGAGLSVQVYKSVAFCNDVMKKFHSNVPNVQNVFHLTIQKLIHNKQPLINPFGRRRDFFSLSKHNKHDVYKEAYSYLPQGTVSDHFKTIALDLDQLAPWALHLFEAHDGLMYEIPISRRYEFAELVQRAAAREISFETCSIQRERKLKIPVEMEYSENNWNDMIELKYKEEKVA